MYVQLSIIHYLYIYYYIMLHYMYIIILYIINLQAAGNYRMYVSHTLKFFPRKISKPINNEGWTNGDADRHHPGRGGFGFVYQIYHVQSEDVNSYHFRLIVQQKVSRWTQMFVHENSGTFWFFN